MEGWPHVADLFELGPDAAAAEGVFVVVQENCAVVGGARAGREGRVSGLCGEHAAAHRGMRAFDFRHV